MHDEQRLHEAVYVKMHDAVHEKYMRPYTYKALSRPPTCMRPYTYAA